jgi:hypothetical protein
VVCPACAFTFAAVGEDIEGGDTCPWCPVGAFNPIERPLTDEELCEREESK